MSVNCHQNQIQFHCFRARQMVFFISLFILSSFVSSIIGKSSEPIIIILGPPGAGLPSSATASTSSGPLGQIEATLSDRDSSGSSRSTFNLFRSTSDKKDDKKGPHIIFIGGSASSPMNNGNNGPMMGSMQGPPPPPLSPNHNQGLGGPGMNNFMSNPNINNNGFGPGPGVSLGGGGGSLTSGPMRRGSNGPGVSVAGTSSSYPPYPISSGSINSGTMVPSYPYIPYVMGGGYNTPSSYPSTGYDYTDYVWNGWKR